MLEVAIIERTIGASLRRCVLISERFRSTQACYPPIVIGLRFMISSVPPWSFDTSQFGILDAANLMLRHHISGLPVIDDTGRLIGIVSEGDFMRRGEIGTQGPRIHWLDFLMGAGKSASDRSRTMNGGRCNSASPSGMELCI